jgi:wyosine [tRNA(Phe)-imidazoG37] synthetase (radical SAM superfamily)
MQPDNKLKVMRNSQLESYNQGLEKIEILQHMIHRFTMEQLENIFQEATNKYTELPKQLTPREIHIKWKQENGKEVFNNLNDYKTNDY